MHFGIISIFPQMFAAISEYGIISRAIKKNLVQISYWNPRDFTTDLHKTVDDRPYGGGHGMVMKIQPLRDAILAAKMQLGENALVVAMTPQGNKVTQSNFERIVQARRNVILVAGRYEGIDERLFDAYVDEEWSIGDFILTGGELPAMVFIDGISRLVAGVLGNEGSIESESFNSFLLDFPQYTRPENFEGMLVPEVLLSGDHAKIAQWRLAEQRTRTKARRPDLYRYRQMGDLNE